MPVPITTTDDPTDFEEAIEAFRRRVPVTPEEWDAMDEAARQQAFKVAGIAQADLVQQVYGAIDGALSDGTTLDDFRGDMAEQLQSAWGGSVANPAWRIETIFRTNLQNAYGAGSYAQRTHPAVLRTRPFWQFDATMDDRTSDICEECNGTTLRADDPWWNDHQPPLHFNCRSTVITLDEDEADEGEGPDDEGPDTEADEGFGGVPQVDGWEPDTSQYDRHIRGVLEGRLPDSE